MLCLDEHGKDQGINVRNKVKDLVSLIQDNERLRDERKRAKKNRDKYVGMSSDDARFHTGRSSKAPSFVFNKFEKISKLYPLNHNCTLASSFAEKCPLWLKFFDVFHVF